MNGAPTRAIYIIRHGEKPDDPPPPNGVDVTGAESEHSLIPRGWQRAGALATLFAPFGGTLRAGLMKPAQLISPDYGSASKSAAHRPYETILPLSELIDVPIETTYAEGDEHKLGKALAAVRTGVTLVCWEHTAIHKIANRIEPLHPGTAIPQDWPGKRFDMVFAFNWDGSQYTFAQVPQMLLDGDSHTPFPA